MSLPMGRFFATIVVASALAAGLPGCGPTLYTANVISAGSAVAEAEAAHADERAPYEYYSAREYLAKAREEASEAHYEAAIRYAGRAHELAGIARDRAQATSSGEDD